jgi:hypothetical protein
MASSTFQCQLIISFEDLMFKNKILKKTLFSFTNFYSLIFFNKINFFENNRISVKVASVLLYVILDLQGLVGSKQIMKHD